MSTAKSNYSSIHLQTAPPNSELNNNNKMASAECKSQQKSGVSTCESINNYIYDLPPRKHRQASELPPPPRVRLVNLSPRNFYAEHIVDDVGTQQPAGTRTIGIALETDEDGIVRSEQERQDGSMCFPLKKVDLVFQQSNKNDEDIERVILQVKPEVRKQDAVWRAIVQARIYIARSRDRFRMATSQVLELGQGVTAPLELQIEPGVDALKLDLRFIYQSHHKMPTFAEGDLNISFPMHHAVGDIYRSLEEELTLAVDKALLAMHTQKLANLLPDVPIELPLGVSRAQFRELLYQIYRSKRPLFTNFPDLCAAAIKLDAKLVLWTLCHEFVHNSDQFIIAEEMPMANVNLKLQKEFEQKVGKAVELGLDGAVRQLCYDAYKTGLWKKMQHQGFNPQKSFGREVYCSLVLPTLIEAIKDKNSADRDTSTQLYEQKNPRPMPHFTGPYEAGNLFNVQLQVNGKIFYVNRGVLHVNRCLDKLAFNEQNNLYLPMVSVELKAELERKQLRLEQMMEPLLQFMYGAINRVPIHLVRACLIFAHDHGMRAIVKDLEEMLLYEPIFEPKLLLSHLWLAEKYKLKNLRRRSLWQLECSEYQQIGLEMLALSDYNKLLSPLAKMQAEDRICSGWAVYDAKLTQREPTNTNILLLNLKGDEAFGLPARDYNQNHDFKDLQTVVLAKDANFDALSDYQDQLLMEKEEHHEDNMRTAVMVGN